MLNRIHVAEECVFAHVSACMYIHIIFIYVCVIHLHLFDLQNAEFKKENSFILIFIAFFILLCIEDLMLLAERSAMLVMNLLAGNEPASPSIYLPFSLLVLLANYTMYQHPFHSEENGKHKRCSIFFVWNVDTSEGDKCFSKKEKRIKTGRNYVFFDTLSAVFLDCCDYKEIISWCIYICIYICICDIQTDTASFPPFKKAHCP